MKCINCGADIYEGVKKCPYCKTLTGMGEDEKFKDFDFKYTLSVSDSKMIESTARQNGKDGGEVKPQKTWPGIPVIKKQSSKDGAAPKVRPVTEPTVDANERAREIAKSASRRAAEFVPEGIARYTVRGMNGEEIKPPKQREVVTEYESVKNTASPVAKEKKRPKLVLKRTKIDKKALVKIGALALCVLAIVLGLSAIGSAVSKSSDKVTSYTYVKDNAMYMVYKNKAAKISEAVIADSYLRAAEEDSALVPAERAAKNAGIVKTSKNGKRTYFFENYDPETNSGVLKYIDKGKVKKIKEISPAAHNSLVLSGDGEELLYLATADKNGDMGVLYYWNDKMDEPFEIATDIDHNTFTFAGDNGYAVFLQNLNRVQMQGDLYVKSLENLKDEKIKIDTNVCSLFGMNPTGKAYVYGKDYDTEDSSFDIYAINKKGRSIRLGERTKKEPLMQKTKDKIFVYGIADDKTNNLYTVDIASGKKEKIATGVNEILMLSKDEKTVIYDKVYTGKLADYYAYTKGKQPVKVAGNVVVAYETVGGKPQMAISKDCSKILYISEFEGFKGGGTLNLTEYKNGKVVSQQQISEDVHSIYRAADGKFIVNKDYSPSRKVFDSYVLEKNELVLIKEEISPELFGVSKKGDNIFCITNFGVEGNYGTLDKVNLKGQAETIAPNVFGFNICDEDIICYKNLNTGDGSFDLFLKRDGKKVLEIETAVDEILN